MTAMDERGRAEIEGKGSALDRENMSERETRG